MDNIELADLLEEYLRRRSHMRSIDPEEIHGIGGLGDAIFLTVSGLRQAAAALRESEELRRDAERLNWLQDNPEHESVPYPEDGRWHVPYMVRSHGDVGSGVGLRTYETLRAAIDSARGAGS